jgi:hypothetical protein
MRWTTCCDGTAERGLTPLLAAAGAGNAVTAETLLAAGAYVGRADIGGLSALATVAVQEVATVATPCTTSPEAHALTHIRMKPLYIRCAHLPTKLTFPYNVIMEHFDQTKSVIQPRRSKMSHRELR